MSKERLGLRVSVGNLFYAAAAKCLKKREPQTKLVLVSANKCFPDERKSVEAGSLQAVCKNRQVDYLLLS